MRPHTSKGGYKDSLTIRRHRAFLLKIIAGAVVALAIIVGAIYFLFFSSVLKITTITINDDTNINKEQVTLAINNFLDTKSWFLRVRRNILFLNSGNLEAVLRDQMPLIKDISISKKYPHGLSVNLKEHLPLGIWCYSGSQCQYFDKDMAVWGNPGHSSGFILLSVDDQRVGTEKVVDEKFFKSILDTIQDLPESITTKEVIIPEMSLNDFKIVTDKGYYIFFSYDSDLAGQLKVLKLFLGGKAKDPSFQPQYIDLRINGRIYYK